MPTFDTPGPIDLAVNLRVGDLQVIASERSDTVVTVTPSNQSRSQDAKGAQQTSVEFDGQRLTIIGPRPRLNWLGPSESVDIKVELPAGSRFTCESSVGGVRAIGHLGATRVKKSVGAVEIEACGDLWLRISHGNATIGEADGSAEVTVDHGQTKLGRIAGDGLLKSSHGSISVGECAGSIDAKLSYGDLEIASALGSVFARTAKGSLKVLEVSAGSIDLESGFGEVVVGVRPGVPAWLDLNTKYGHVRNDLDGNQPPADAASSVAVRVNTKLGDIRVRRGAASAA